MVEIIGIAGIGKSCRRPGCRHQGTLVELVGRTEQNRRAIDIEEYLRISLVEADRIEVLLHIRHHTMVSHSFITAEQAAAAMEHILALLDRLKVN